MLWAPLTIIILNLLIVFGWLNGTTRGSTSASLTLAERTEAYTVSVGYLKGGTSDSAAITLRYDITNISSSASKLTPIHEWIIGSTCLWHKPACISPSAPDVDFSVATTRVGVDRILTSVPVPASVNFTLFEDSIVLEPSEVFFLNLTAAVSRTSAYERNSFVFIIRTLQITVLDSPGLSFVLYTVNLGGSACINV